MPTHRSNPRTLPPVPSDPAPAPSNGFLSPGQARGGLRLSTLERRAPHAYQRPHMRSAAAREVRRGGDRFLRWAASPGPQRRIDRGPLHANRSTPSLLSAGETCRPADRRWSRRWFRRLRLGTVRGAAVRGAAPRPPRPGPNAAGPASRHATPRASPGLSRPGPPVERATTAIC